MCKQAKTKLMQKARNNLRLDSLVTWKFLTSLGQSKSRSFRIHLAQRRRSTCGWFELRQDHYTYCYQIYILMTTKTVVFPNKQTAHKTF